MPHSDQAARGNRNCFYSLTYYFGKPSLWFSFNPAVHCNITFTHLVTKEIYDIPPTPKVRYDMLANNSGAAAIQFEKILRIVIDDIFGWRNDLAGTSVKPVILHLTYVFSMAVETDWSQSLHCHSLI